MKRKGFTLIELLAVIVILAVIALIATPMIMNYIEDARDGALKATARNIIDTGEKMYAKELLDNPNETPVISFDELEYQGEQMEQGTIEFDEQGLASIAIFHQNKCIYKNPTDKDVILDKTLDETECLQKLGEILIQGVTLDKTSLTMSVGGNEILKATIVPETTTQDKTLTWESSNPEVATVTNGVVEAVGLGKATITVRTSNGKTATCEVTTQIPITGVSLNKTELILKPEETETLVATIAPGNTSMDQTLTWESSNSSVATVTNGVVKAISIGTTTITVRTSNGKTATCTVAVAKNGVELLLSKANGSSITNYTSGNTGEMYTFSHLATSQTGALTDYRYIGNIPNNYITFNNETWRIIGVFDGRIKIVKDTSIGNLIFDYKQSVGSATGISGSSDWTDSQLMYLLNPTTFTLKSGYTNDGTHIRDANGKIVYQLGCNPAKTDGSSYSCVQNSWSLNETALSQVDSVTWYLGGSSSNSHSAESYYAFERGTDVYSGRQASWKGKVGLMYPSDYAYTYAYGVDDQCYNDNYNCSKGTPSAGWLYNGAAQWLLSPDSSYSHVLFYVRIQGCSIDYGDAYITHNTRPVVHLRSDIQLTGTGTSSDPYKIVG